MVKSASRSFLGPLCLALVLAAGGAPAAEGPKPAAPAHLFVIGISPFLGKSVKDEVYRNLVRLLLEEMPLDSRLTVYDGFHLTSITEVTLPSVGVFKSPKTRANQFYPAIRDLKVFLAAEPPKPASPGLDFDAAIRLPQFCDFLADNVASTNAPLTLLLIGSPLYQDAKEPAFSMVDGYFPSDGHLRAPVEKSIFGLGPRTRPLPPFVAHWVYFGDPWISDLHREKVTRFWTLYLERRGGQLASFTGDFPTALRGFREASTGTLGSSGRWALDPEPTRIEMLRVGRSLEVTDWLTRDALPQTEPPPPAVLAGPMKIGIRWRENLDLDLYASPRPGAETLFFQHQRSPEGYYYKDHRSSPGREYEFIEFEVPVPVREVEAFVNFYQGTCPGGPSGEVRIEFGNRIYSAPFSIPASEGNLGRSGPGQADHWCRIPIPDVLKLGRLGMR